MIVSPEYEIVIPKAICEALNIQPGQTIQVFQFQNRIELIPIIPIKCARGYLKGIDTSVPREDDLNQGKKS